MAGNDRWTLGLANTAGKITIYLLELNLLHRVAVKMPPKLYGRRVSIDNNITGLLT